MKAMMIVNPVAHSGVEPQQREARQEEVFAQLKSALPLDSINQSETKHPGHGRELAEEAARTGYDYIFAAGGDGTVNEVLNGIMGLQLEQHKRPKLGVLPYGTSNDFFAALKAVQALHKLNNPTLGLDVGHVRFDNIDRYFCLTAGMGMFSWANEKYIEASKTFGRRFAHVPAAIKTFMGYQFLPDVQIAQDGKHSQERRVLAVIVNNSPIIAGGLPLTPDAVVDDGHFDVCVVKPASPLRLIALLFQVATKTHLHSRRVIAIGRIRELTVTAKRALPINIDGELVPELDSLAHRMTIEVMPHALQVVVPSLCEIIPEATEGVPVPT